MSDATKFQDDERLSGKKRDGITGVVHHVDFHGIETLLFQRNVQSRIKYAMHVSLELDRLVDYSKKWRLRVSGYKTDGARTVVSVWIWRSTRED